MNTAGAIPLPKMQPTSPRQQTHRTRLPDQSAWPLFSFLLQQRRTAVAHKSHGMSGPTDPDYSLVEC